MTHSFPSGGHRASSGAVAAMCLLGCVHSPPSTGAAISMSSSTPTLPSSAVAPGLVPRSDEIAITKSAAGAFSKTALHQILTDRSVDTLIIAGLMTHLAVDTTARDATVLGYRVMIAGDATATRSLPGPRGDGV